MSDSPPPPPLPPSLVRPSHQRTLSSNTASSSSSSSISPRQTQQPFASSHATVRRPESASPLSAGLARSKTLNSSSPGSSSSSPTLTRRTSSLTPSLSNSPRTSPSTTRPSSQATSSTISRARASSVLTKASPTSTHTRYASTPSGSSSSSIASVGLRGLGTSSFSRGLGQLPSPPNTASDGASNGSGLAGTNEREGGERRRNASETPTMKRSFQVPSIERSSSTVVGSPREALERRQASEAEGVRRTPSTLSSPSRRSNTSRTSLEARSNASSGSPLPSSRTLRDSQSSAESEGEGMSRQLSSSASSTPTERGEDRPTGEHHRRESSGSIEGEDTESRLTRRAKRAAEVKKKNQRILDSINSPTLPLASPPPSRRPASPRTSSSDALLTNATSVRPLLRTRASVDEFGLSDERGSARRSRTLGDEKQERERERRVRTLGASSEERWNTGSVRRRAEGEGERSYTSLSSYSTTEGRSAGSARRGDSWLEREYGRSRASSSMDVRRSARRYSEDEPPLPSPTSRTSPSLRTRPALPREFIDPPSSARRSLDQQRSSTPRIASPSLRERLEGPRTVSPASTAGTPTDRHRRWTSNVEEGVFIGHGEGELGDLPSPRPPRAGSLRAKKGSGGSGSAGKERRYEGEGRERDIREGGETPERRRSVSRVRDRTQSDLSAREAEEVRRFEREDVFRNGLQGLETRTQGTITPPARLEDRYGAIAADLHERKERKERKERLRASEVGSEAWMSEFQDLRQRSTRSRASGSSGDTRSTRDVLPASPQNPMDRDRTLRAINALLAGQGIVASDIGDPAAQTSPTKLEFGSAHRRRFSIAESSLDSPQSSSGLSRSSTSASLSSRAGAESSRSVRFGAAANSEHHKLLHQAFDYFEHHFTLSEGRDGSAPESADLVKTITATVSATTKINAGLRALASAAIDAQIEAQLDERSRSPAIGLVQFEKSINSLLRSSDDQVRSLTEGLIAFTRVERERERLRRDADGNGSRPSSRAGLARGPFNGSPKRPATSSPFEGATISTSSSRPLTASGSARQALRNPMDELDLPRRATTLSFSSRSPRSPFGGQESPTPGSRKELASLKSPLSSSTDGWPTTSSHVVEGLPPPPSSSRSAIRRSKSSSTSTATIQPSTPTATSFVRFPRASFSKPSSMVDPTNATTESSPTMVYPASFPRTNGHRTYSEVDRHEGLGINDGDRDSWRHTLHSASALSFPSGSVVDEELNSPEQGRRARHHLSTGSMGLGQGVGAALRSGLSMVGFRGRRNTNEEAPSVPAPKHLPPLPAKSTPQGSPEERRAERRAEVEQILRRTTARSSIG